MKSRSSNSFWFFRQSSLLLVGLLGSLLLDSTPAYSAPLRVLKSGLGDGTVVSSPSGINCGTDCEQGFSDSEAVTLTATPGVGSTFAGWDIDPSADSSSVADCTGADSCTLNMGVARAVRPVFNLAPIMPTLSDFTPAGIQVFLTSNPSVTTPSRFVAALPEEYRQNWLLMTRSESLQTGTADLPRILLPSEDARFTFTIGMKEHSSYPGAHPNAIEFMQWDGTEKNFRFHEIVLDNTPEIGNVPPRTRGVSADDEKCTRCHSTRNVLNPGALPGTTGIVPGLLKAKNKPNWDTYDSWGGMLSFNRDRIYQGSVEAASFRKLLNPWTWQGDIESRRVIEQLLLQPPGIPSAHQITRLGGGSNDGQIRFGFDPATPATIEPAPTGSESTNISYGFNGVSGTPPGTAVERGGEFVTLHHTSAPTSDEGRGVNYFDHLGGLDGTLNQQRVAAELIDHRFATGSFPNQVVDVRPVSLAIANGCLAIDSATNSISSSPALTIDTGFFESRNGMTISQLVADTRSRATSLPRRKADIQSINLNRDNDIYTEDNTDVEGLVQLYGASTSQGTSVTLARLRQDVFRRPIDLGFPDDTVMGGVYVDRELYNINTNQLAMYRYFLEPLGVSVDKWSMGVRGRSRTYTFADIFGTYTNQFRTDLRTSLESDPRTTSIDDTNSCGQLIAAVNSTLASLPAVNDVPTYTDVQRIFNKSCIECHGGLDYPPYSNYGSELDLSEDEAHVPPDDRLDRSHSIASDYVTTDPETSYLFDRITQLSEDCPYGLMPCGGPALSRGDIETISRWIVGAKMNTRGDPHIHTMSGENYDFQAAGEFVLLKGQGLEVQTRQTAVPTAVPLGPNDHTGLKSCVSVNTAAAVRIGKDRITVQSELNGQANPEQLDLRINGQLERLTKKGVFLPGGGRIIQTTAKHGLKIEMPGGGSIVITPVFWNHHQMWYMNIDASNMRATSGLAGVIAPGNWLPSLPDGTQLGTRPGSLQERYELLYEKFGASWRVEPKNALFDYEPGTSTESFTDREWPRGESPSSCIIADARKPQEPLERVKAEAACGNLVDKVALENCIQDVMATGEGGFGQLYSSGEVIERNRPPKAAQLVSPESFALKVNRTPEFLWKASQDADNDSVVYQLCVWPIEERYRRQRHCSKAPGGIVGKKVIELNEAGAYYWKVIAEDNRGGTTQSETRRFQAQ